MLNYLLQQPSALESLAAAKFGAWVELKTQELMTLVWELHQQDATDAQTALTQQIEIIQNYLESKMAQLGRLHEALVALGIQALSQLLKKTSEAGSSWRSHPKYDEASCQKNIILQMIRALFNRSLTRLKLSRDNVTVLGSLLFSESYVLTCLTHLKLDLAPPSRDNLNNANQTERDIIKFLQGLHNLKHFSLNSYCTDNILRCISDSCTLMEELDLNYSGTRVNDDSVDILTRMRNLRIIHLCGTSVGRRGIETALLSCKNIEHINIGGGISYILEHIASSEEYGGETFKLKTFNTSAPLKQLRLVARMCPLIRNITVFKNKTLQSNVMALTDLPSLRILKLVDYHYKDDQVEEMLAVVGPKLAHLNLEGVDDIDLMYVSQMCPHLETLSILNCTFTEFASQTELEIPPLRELRRLSIDWYVYEELSPRINLQNALIFLLSNSFKIEYVYIGPLIPVDENVMLKVLDTNPLICLKELKIWQSAARPQTMTTLVLDRIMCKCASLPTVIQLTRFYSDGSYV